VKYFVTLWTAPSLRLNVGQLRSAPAYPSDTLCRYSRHQGVHRDIPRNHSACRNQSEGADFHAGEDYALRSKARAGFYAGLSEPSSPMGIARGNRGERHPRTSRIHIVREADTRADKDIISDFDPVPHHRLIFDGDPISDPCARFNKSMVAYVTVAPDHCALHHMSKCPYPRPGANMLALAKCEAMNENVGSDCHGLGSRRAHRDDNAATCHAFGRCLHQTDDPPSAHTVG
jgi:hypothetical protein